MGELYLLSGLLDLFRLRLMAKGSRLKLSSIRLLLGWAKGLRFQGYRLMATGSWLQAYSFWWTCWTRLIVPGSRPSPLPEDLLLYSDSSSSFQLLPEVWSSAVGVGGMAPVRIFLGGLARVFPGGVS